MPVRVKAGGEVDRGPRNTVTEFGARHLPDEGIFFYLPKKQKYLQILLHFKSIHPFFRHINI